MSIELELAEVRIVEPPREDVLATAFDQLNAVMLGGPPRAREGNDSPRARRVGRARPVRLAVAVATVAALVVAICVVTIGNGSNAPYSNPSCTSVRSCSVAGTSPGQRFVLPTQTSGATWSLTGLVAASGWYPQSVGATQAVQLICPTAKTCIASGADLGVDQNALPYQQDAIEVSSDAGATWRVAAVPPDGESFNGFTCPSSTTCMTVGVQPNHGSGPPPPSLYVTTDGGATWTLRAMPGAVWATAALSCSTTTSCVVVEQTEGFTAFVTEDAGRTWARASLPAGFLGPSGPNSMQCSSDGQCVAVGYSSLAYAGPAAFAYSSDGGRTWRMGSAPTLSSGVGALSCSDDLHCMAIETAGLKNGLSQVSGVVTTSDGGRTWTDVSAHGLGPNSAPKYLTVGALACVTPTRCLASGQSGGSATFDSNAVTQGLVAATTDGGESWQLESLPTIDHHAIEETSSITCPVGSQACFVGAFTAGVDSSIILASHGTSQLSASKSN